MLHPFLTTEGPVGFAHRGGAGPHPENTERAFRHAMDLGFRYLETDVHATADGVLVAFHDDRLDRVTDRAGALDSLTWSDVSRARVDGTDPILRLEEMLEAFPDALVNIDPKAWAAVEPLASTLVRMNALERVCVTSFNRRRTRAVKKLAGDRLCTGGAAGAVVELYAGAPLGMLDDVDVVQLPTRARGLQIVNERLVRRAHRRGIHVHVWTIDDADEMHRLLDLGVDGIMTDEPASLRSVFLERGIWSS
ncbi:MAG: glycerophosphodiester phosphodiesterase [Acidimicrobiales bacterium]